MTITKVMTLPLALAMVALLGISTVGAQTAPRVGIQLATSGLSTSLRSGDSDAVLARLLLDTTGSSEAVRVTTLPFRLTTGSGALASSLEDCMVVNESNSSVSLNTGSNEPSTLSSGLNSIILDNPLVVPANSTVTLSLRCDVGSNLVTNGTYTFSMNSSEVAATGVSTGLPAVVYVRGSVTGVPGGVSNPGAPVTPSTPGLPTTGSGGDAVLNISILLGSLALGVAGYMTLRKARA